MKVTDQLVSQKNVFTDVPAFNESRLMGTHQLIKHSPAKILEIFFTHNEIGLNFSKSSGLSTLGISSRKVELTCFNSRKKFDTALHTSCLMIPLKKKKVGIESIQTRGFIWVKTQHNLLDFIRRDLSNSS